MTFLWMAASLALAAPGAPGEPDPRFCDQDQPKHCAMPIQRGQAAPFEGQLLTTELAIDLGLKADSCGARITLETDFCKKSAAVELDLEKRLREIDRVSCNSSTSLLQKRLEAAYEPVPLYERPWFVATVTTVLVVTAGSLAVWGAGQLR